MKLTAQLNTVVFAKLIQHARHVLMDTNYFQERALQFVLSQTAVFVLVYPHVSLAKWGMFWLKITNSVTMTVEFINAFIVIVQLLAKHAILGSIISMEQFALSTAQQVNLETQQAIIVHLVLQTVHHVAVKMYAFLVIIFITLIVVA